MTLKNSRASLLCYFKLCASFHSHWWIQTGVTAQKRPIWVKIDYFCSHVTLKFDGWSYSPETAKWGHDLCDLDRWPWPFAWTSLISLVITPENFVMIRWWEHSQKGVTDRRTDWTIHRAAWSQLKTTSSMLLQVFLHHFIAIGEFKLELQSGNAQFGSNSTIFRAMWPWNLTYDLAKQ